MALVSLADWGKRHGQVFAACPRSLSSLVLVLSLILP